MGRASITARLQKAKEVASKEVTSNKKRKSIGRRLEKAGHAVHTSSLYDVFENYPPYSLQESVVNSICEELNTTDVKRMQKKAKELAVQVEQLILERANAYINENGGTLKIFKDKNMDLTLRKDVSRQSANTALAFSILEKMKGC